MVVSKDKKLKKKAIENDYGNARLCSICNKTITHEDVETNNFEYCKTKIGENFAHSSCVNKMIKHK